MSVDIPPISITGISPSSASVGAPITISGANMSITDQVFFQDSTGATTQTGVTSCTGTSVTVVVPSIVSGPYSVFCETGHGSGKSNLWPFTVN